MTAILCGIIMGILLRIDGEICEAREPSPKSDAEPDETHQGYWI